MRTSTSSPSSLARHEVRAPVTIASRAQQVETAVLLAQQAIRACREAISRGEAPLFPLTEDMCGRIEYGLPVHAEENIPHKASAVDGVNVEHFAPSLDSPEWQSLRHLYWDWPFVLHPIGSQRQAASTFRQLMSRQEFLVSDTIFVLPDTRLTLQNPEGTGSLLKLARQNQRRYRNWLRSILGTGRDARNAMEGEKGIPRQLSLTGILLIKGHHYPPNQWDRVRNKN